MAYREKYLRRAKVAAGVLRFVPFLRMAALNGSLVRGDEKASSDIDFLIIAKRGRLYTARFFATLLVHLTGHRRYGDKVAGRVCLNCYLNNQNPDISPRDPKSRQKVANAYKYLIPLVEESKMYDKFMGSNVWMKKYPVSGGKYQVCLIKKLIPYGPVRPIPILNWFFESTIGDFIEKRLMNYQQKRILHGKDGFDELVATEKEIRLHPKKE
jgi:hypothetical protein